MARTFEVRWITRVENMDSFAGAAKEAWADIIETIMNGEGATVIVVDEIVGEGDDEKHGAGVAFDMAKPWEPDIIATNKIEKSDPSVFSDRDRAEAALFQKAYDKMKSARDEVKNKFASMYNDGLVN